MRILLVSQKPNAPTITGEEVFAGNLINGLEGRGLDAQSCAVGSDTWGPRGLTRLLRYSRIPGIARASQMLRGTDDFDIIHFLDSSLVPAGLFKKAAKIATSNVLGRAHYLFRDGGGAAGRLAESAYGAYSSLIDAYAFRRLDRLVALSPFHARDLASSYCIPESRIETIAPGVDAGRIARCGRTDLRGRYGCERVVVYIARLDSPAKGLRHFLAAAELLRDEPISFLVIGDGFERRPCEKLVRDRGLSGRVHFLGALGFDEKNTILKSADATVIPSVSETFCMVFAESLAAGVPVVAYDLPFWKGLYDGAGLFVKRDDASLAAGIRKALESAGLRSRLRSKGFALAKRYCVENMVSGYVRLYERLSWPSLRR